MQNMLVSFTEYRRVNIAKWQRLCRLTLMYIACYFIGQIHGLKNIIGIVKSAVGAYR